VGTRAKLQLCAKRFKMAHEASFRMTPDYTPRRIVSLQPSATVILRAIGRLDRLVACTKYCLDVCPEAGLDGRSGDS